MTFRHLFFSQIPPPRQPTHTPFLHPLAALLLISACQCSVYCQRCTFPGVLPVLSPQKLFFLHERSTWPGWFVFQSGGALC